MTRHCITAGSTSSDDLQACLTGAVVALLDLLFLWSTWLEPRLQKHWPQAVINGLAILTSGLILAIEHRFAQIFISRWSNIHETQNSWRATLDQADAFSRKARRKGEPVNLIFTKSWFKRSDTIKKLPFDHLVYLYPEKRIQNSRRSQWKANLSTATSRPFSTLGPSTN